MIISGSVLLRMRNISDMSCRENQNTHFVFRNFFERLAVYEIVWKRIGEPDRPQMTVRRLRIACWIIVLHILRIFLLCHCHNGHTNAYQSYVIRTLPVYLIALSDILKKDAPCIVHVQEYLTFFFFFFFFLLSVRLCFHFLLITNFYSKE